MRSALISRMAILSINSPVAIGVSMDWVIAVTGTLPGICHCIAETVHAGPPQRPQIPDIQNPLNGILITSRHRCPSRFTHVVRQHGGCREQWPAAVHPDTGLRDVVPCPAHDARVGQTVAGARHRRAPADPVPLVERYLPHGPAAACAVARWHRA